MTGFKEALAAIENRTSWGYKIYFVDELKEHMLKHQNSEMLTSVEAVKGISEVIKQIIKAGNDLFSTAVSRVRQPVEAIFNWLIEKTDKVREIKGLMIHAFARLATAFITLAISLLICIINRRL